MTINKKLLLGLGSAGILVAPVISVVSCSSDSPKQSLGLKAKDITDMSLETQVANLSALKTAFGKDLSVEANKTEAKNALGKYFTLEKTFDVSKVKEVKTPETTSLKFGDKFKVEAIAVGGYENFSSKEIVVSRNNLPIEPNSNITTTDLDLETVKANLKLLVIAQEAQTDGPAPSNTKLDTLKKYLNIEASDEEMISLEKSGTILTVEAIDNLTTADEFTITLEPKDKANYQTSTYTFDINDLELGATDKTTSIASTDLEIIKFRENLTTPTVSTLSKYITISTEQFKNVERVEILKADAVITDLTTLLGTDKVKIKLVAKAGFKDFTSAELQLTLSSSEITVKNVEKTSITDTKKYLNWILGEDKDQLPSGLAPYFNTINLDLIENVEVSIDGTEITSAEQIATEVSIGKSVIITLVMKKDYADVSNTFEVSKDLTPEGSK